LENHWGQAWWVEPLWQNRSPASTKKENWNKDKESGTDALGLTGVLSQKGPGETSVLLWADKDLDGKEENDIVPGLGRMK